MTFSTTQHEHTELYQSSPFLPKNEKQDSSSCLDEKEYQGKNNKIRRLEKLKPYIYATVIAILSSLLTITLLNLFTPLPSYQDSSQHLKSHEPILEPAKRCGKSVEEAITLGCTYDALSKSWLPQDCPREFEDEWIGSAGNGKQWRYWLDENATKEIDGIDGLARIGKLYYWTTAREHLTHCIYMLHRVDSALTRITEGGIMRVDSSTRRSNHIKHCLDMLQDVISNPENDNKIGANGDVGFGSC